MRAKLIPLFFCISVLLAGKTAYDYYKSYFWPEVAATVLSTRETCLFSKGRSSRHAFCDDQEEAARLIAEGFKLRDAKRLRIEAVYEGPSGQKVSTTLDPFLKDAWRAKPGSMIRIRLSPATPGSSELALVPDGTQGLIALGTAALVGTYGWFFFRRRRLLQQERRRVRG